jgi:hypothetical protein
MLSPAPKYGGSIFSILYDYPFLQENVNSYLNLM